MEKWQLDAAVANFLGVPGPIVFWDELNAALPAMQGAAMSLLGPAYAAKSQIVRKMAKKLGKKVQKLKVLVLNPEDVGGIPHRIAPAIENRLTAIQLPPGDGSWLPRGAARRVQRQARGARRAPANHPNRSK